VRSYEGSLCVFVCVAVTLACDGSVSVRTRAQEDASAGNVTREAGREATFAFGEASTGGPFVLPACDAGTAATSAADAAPPPGDPPADCIAPCVWDLIKRCQPVGACATQVVPSGLPWNGDVSCAPENHWWRISSPGHLGLSFDVYLDNRLCYGFSGKNIGGTVGFNPNAVVKSWDDGAGHLVAIGEGYPSTTVSCGSFPPGFPYNHPAGSVTISATYVVDETQPHCAPWIRTPCEPGCCAGNPPALPEVTLSL